METIGLFIDFNRYATLLQQAQSGAHAAGVRLVIFNGGYLYKPSASSTVSLRSMVYSLADQHNIDALVVAAELFSNFSQEETGEFLARFAGIPVVTLGISLPGITSILADNASGMAELMDHLLDFHGYRKLAYIGGPPNHIEADIRQSIFCKKLAEKGLDPKPEWMAHGNFSKSTGMVAMQQLLNQNDTGFEGVVCANDAMATGALEILQEHGLQVPKDYFVTGFDDDESSKFLTSPLTTVQQDESGNLWEAIRQAIALQRSPQEARQIAMPASLKLRVSCGCKPWMTQSVSIQADNHPAMAWIHRLEQLASDYPWREKSNLFLDHLYDIIADASPSQRGALWDALPILSGNEAPWVTAMDSLEREHMHLSISRVLTRAEHNSSFKLRHQTAQTKDMISRIGEDLATSPSLQRIHSALLSTIYSFGYRGIWLSLYKDLKRPLTWLEPYLEYDT
jgi:DNA-binding LacI/PurR family transcriptional regulator